MKYIEQMCFTNYIYRIICRIRDRKTEGKLSRLGNLKFRSSVNSDMSKSAALYKRFQ